MACQTCLHWRRHDTFRGECSFLQTETTAWTHCGHYDQRIIDPGAERYRIVRDPQGFVSAVPDEG